MPYGYSPTDVNASGMANSTTLSSVPSKYSEAKQMFRQDGDKVNSPTLSSEPVDRIILLLNIFFRVNCLQLIHRLLFKRK